MKIAFVYDLIYPYSKGGVEKRIADVAKGLVERGHEIHVFGTKQWDGPDRLVVDGIVLRGISVNAGLYSRRGRRSIRQGLIFSLALAVHLSRERFDLIDAQSMSPLSCLAAVMVSRLRRIPSVVTWHEVWRRYWIEYLGPIGAVGWFTEWLIARLGATQVAVSDTTAGKLEALGVSNAPVLANGVDLSRINSVARRSNRSSIVYVGRLLPHKNVELLIDAARVLSDRGLAPIIEIIGEGPHRATLERRASNLPNVRFLGSVKSDLDVVDFLKSARVFALPSVREGFGICALEAMACGVPVVTVDHPDNSTTDFIVSGHNGLITIPEAHLFAEALMTLVTDDTIHCALADRALATATRFDWPLLLDAFEATYSQALEARPMLSSGTTPAVASRW